MTRMQQVLSNEGIEEILEADSEEVFQVSQSHVDELECKDDLFYEKISGFAST